MDFPALFEYFTRDLFFFFRNKNMFYNRKVYSKEVTKMFMIVRTNEFEAKVIEECLNEDDAISLAEEYAKSQKGTFQVLHEETLEVIYEAKGEDAWRIL